MTVVLYMRVPELTPDGYAALVGELGLDEMPPRGLLLHVASEGVGAVNVCEVWETEQHAERFVQGVLRRVLGRHGVTEPLAYRLEPVRDMVAP
jgi:hypothetical protein